MNFLDLDLDFFQNDIAHGADDYGKRLDDSFTTPWKEEKLIKFLEIKLGLNKINKIKGRIVTHHNEVFYLWRELIISDKLDIPFQVTHIDAHSDLGLGDGSWHYLMTEYIHRDYEERIYPENIKYPSKIYKFGYGNYLAFAIACNWIRNIEFIVPSMWSNDFPISLLKDYDDNTKTIQLKKFDRGKSLDFHLLKEYEPVCYEKEVPFEIYKENDFEAKKQFDYIALSTSPGYTVKDSDKLIDIISDYIDFI